MKFSRMLQAIDTHTAGEAARLITGGIPFIPGKTMADKKQYLQDNNDNLRTALMLEPRGHNDMFGAFILAPTIEEAHFGIIFMDAGGYLNMCGHNSIAAVTAAVETGIVPPTGEEITPVNLDTPAGLVKAKAFMKDDFKVEKVSFENVASFLYKKDQKMDVEGLGTITFDISFGGSFFVIIHASELGLEIKPEFASKISEIGMTVLNKVNETIKMEHPTLSHIKTADLIEIYDKPTHPDATHKNVVVFGDGQIDRSPCGTGTSAKVATLFAKGELAVGESIVYESILGTLFTGKVLRETELAGYQAIIPEVSGSAYITGFNTFLFDPEDPLSDGFVLA